MKSIILSFLIVSSLLLAGCQPTDQPAVKGLQVLAVESFLADITRNVAGQRATVTSLIPLGMDPHEYEPSPKDITRLAQSTVLVVNGGGLESWQQPVLNSVGGQRLVITASQGLANRTPGPGEFGAGQGQIDPHFWLDPVDVIQYVKNIRDGLSEADPGGKAIYTANAAAYIAQLEALDSWILQQVDQIPPERRLLVTNHESFGYFADRYGFKIVGTIIPSITTGSSPSAQDMAHLIDQIRATGVHAIFLEAGSNPQLADQIASETGIKVVTGLYTHSTSGPDGPAPTYIDMMKANVDLIVQALQ